MPPQTNGWRTGAAVVLFGLFLASALQLSLVANITKLPRETLEFFADPNVSCPAVATCQPVQL
jgi:hypothetical protein